METLFREGEPMTKTISIYNFKGGVGKTSLSFLLGNYLAMKGKKVLLIDSDPQSSLTKYSRG